jgi:hypothetical protein
LAVSSFNHFAFYLNDTISYPVAHYVSLKSGPLSTYVFQSLYNGHLFQRDAFEVFNATVLPVSRNWESSTHNYTNDPVLTKFMDATPLHMSQIWLRFDNELSTWLPEDQIHDIRNNTNLETNHLTLYKQDLAKLKHGTWLGNIIIDFFIWNMICMLIKIGTKDVYKRFKIWTAALCITCLYSYAIATLIHVDAV